MWQMPHLYVDIVTSFRGIQGLIGRWIDQSQDNYITIE